VSFDLAKAETKLKAIRQQLKRTQELAAARVHLLTTAETKPTAAIVAALLSEWGKEEAPAPIPPTATGGGWRHTPEGLRR
jgi:hypothetical protein